MMMSVSGEHSGRFDRDFHGLPAMPYTLWNHGQMLAECADLRFGAVVTTMAEGMLEPTEAGRQALADATCVWRAIAERKRGIRARGERTVHDDALVREAMRRREELDLEMRDQNGTALDCDFISVIDLFDMKSGLVDEMSDTEEEEEAEYQIQLSALSGEERETAMARRAEMQADIDAMVAEFVAEQDERDLLSAARPPVPPPDPRQETMQYLVQVHMKGSDWDDLEGWRD